MIQTGSMLLYGNQVCRVCQEKEEVFHGTRRNYYLLQPIYDTSSMIYVPSDNPKLMGKMRQILSPEEIHQLIREIPNQETKWIADDRQRSDTWKEVLSTGDRKKLVKMIKTLYEKKQEIEAAGRKFHAADENALRQAEQMIHDEFALVLDIQRDQVAPFIAQQIEIQKKEEVQKS